MPGRSAVAIAPRAVGRAQNRQYQHGEAGERHLPLFRRMWPVEKSPWERLNTVRSTDPLSFSHERHDTRCSGELVGPRGDLFGVGVAYRAPNRPITTFCSPFRPPIPPRLSRFTDLLGVVSVVGRLRELYLPNTLKSVVSCVCLLDANFARCVSGLGE